MRCYHSRVRDTDCFVAVVQYDVRERGAGAETDAAVAAVRASQDRFRLTRRTRPLVRVGPLLEASSAPAGDRVLYAIAKDEALLRKPVLAQFATGPERHSFQDIPSTLECVLFMAFFHPSSRAGESSSSSRTMRTSFSRAGCHWKEDQVPPPGHDPPRRAAPPQHRRGPAPSSPRPRTRKYLPLLSYLLARRRFAAGPGDHDLRQVRRLAPAPSSDMMKILRSYR